MLWLGLKCSKLNIYGKLIVNGNVEQNVLSQKF